MAHASPGSPRRLTTPSSDSNTYYGGSYLYIAGGTQHPATVGWETIESPDPGLNGGLGRFWTNWFHSGAALDFCCNSNVSSAVGDLRPADHRRPTAVGNRASGRRDRPRGPISRARPGISPLAPTRPGSYGSVDGIGMRDWSMAHRVTCINKTLRPDPHERIDRVGRHQSGRRRMAPRPGGRDRRDRVRGSGRSTWKALPAGDRVDVVVAVSRFGNKYLKTTSDGDNATNNLLASPGVGLATRGSAMAYRTLRAVLFETGTTLD